MTWFVLFAGVLLWSHFRFITWAWSHPNSWLSACLYNWIWAPLRIDCHVRWVSLLHIRILIAWSSRGTHFPLEKHICPCSRVHDGNFENEWFEWHLFFVCLFQIWLPKECFGSSETDQMDPSLDSVANTKIFYYLRDMSSQIRLHLLHCSFFTFLFDFIPFYLSKKKCFNSADCHQM